MTSGDQKNRYIHDDIELSKNLPNYNTVTNMSGEKSTNYIHSDIELYKNLPQYETNSNVRGNEQHIYIHNDIELNKTLPEYETRTNNNGNQRKNVEFEYIKPLENNNPVVKDIVATQTLKGENNISAKEYFGLNEKLVYGSFQNQGTVPNQERMQNVVYKNDPVKSQFNKNILQNYNGRF